MNEYDYDVAVIGGGSGGYAAARTTANAGLRTVVIEGGREIGGLCILRGCMPTKALLYAAEVKHLAERPNTWGIHSQKVTFDYAEVMARKNLLVEEFKDHRTRQLTEATFNFIRAHARFTDKHTLVLSTGEKLTAKNFIISTGSVVSPPPFPFLKDLDYITSDEALALKRLPKSLIILGGGSVAIEAAQFFVRFDVEVSLIQRGPGILRDYDTDATRELEKVLRREGVKLFTNTQLTGASRNGALKKISFLHDAREVHIEAEEVLFALGRVANTASLDLDKAGVKTDGFRVVTNDALQTAAPHIYAAGDCVGPHDVVHLAVIQGETAAHNIISPRRPGRMDYRLLAGIVFTEPQLAKVGLTEQEALSRNIPYLAASHPFADHGKSIIMDALDGFVKLLADPISGEIIGGSCLGPLGGELIHEIIAAMHKRMTVRELADMPHYHPTLAEIWSYPAEELADKISPRSD